MASVSANDLKVDNSKSKIIMYVSMTIKKM